MSKDLTLKQDVPPAVAERGLDAETWNTLKNAVYPNASDNMVILAMDYCKARGLDVMKKPVHIVKTWDNGKTVETIWEGIASLRTTAARTGVYAGMDEAEFGPLVDDPTISVGFKFPEWCRITIYRMVKGKRVPFTSKLYWTECYAAGKFGKGVNAMWTKRRYAQLAKCVEADALRKAFPEELGGMASAEEMDGREIGSDLHYQHSYEIAHTPEAIDALIRDVSSPEKTEQTIEHDGLTRAEPIDREGGAGEKDAGADQGQQVQKPAPAAKKVPQIPATHPRTGEVRTFPTVQDWCEQMREWIDEPGAEPIKVMEQNADVFGKLSRTKDAAAALCLDEIKKYAAEADMRDDDVFRRDAGGNLMTTMDAG